jgi:hypothetical protein
MANAAMEPISVSFAIRVRISPGEGGAISGNQLW